MVKVGVVLDAPRIRLRVRACRTHGDELFEHDVPHLRVPRVGHVVQDDAARATRSVHVITRIHDAFGWYNTLPSGCENDGVSWSFGDCVMCSGANHFTSV